MKTTYQKITSCILLTTIFVSFLLFAGCDMTNDDTTSTTVKQEEHATIDVPKDADPENNSEITDETAQATTPVDVTTPTTPNAPTEGTEPASPTDPTAPTSPEDPSEPTEPGSTIDPTEPQTPDETDPMPSDPSATEPEVSSKVTYMDYYNMSAEEQQAFIDSFESIDAFFAWHTAAKKEYEDNRTPIDGSTPIIP